MAIFAKVLARLTRKERRFDYGPDELRTIGAVKPYTLVSDERIVAVIDAVRYVARASILGSVVECGVWRGGAMMAAAMTLIAEGDTTRHLYLFDTFEGMPEPAEWETNVWGTKALDRFRKLKAGQTGSLWCNASLEDVRKAMALTGYPMAQVNLVKGKVEDTIPEHAPESIAMLRLDTDWYESTKHELTHLYPRLSRRGVLILDDYGHWTGARKAVDEYLAMNNIDLLLNRTDYTGRVATKT